MKIDLNKFNFESDKILLSLTKEEQSLVSTYFEELTFKKKKLIFYERGTPTGVFFLTKGRAKIFKVGLEGKEQIFYIYKSGDLLGYHPLLCNEHYEDSCEALEDCEILFIRRSNFEVLLKQIPQLRTLLIQNMGHEFGVLVNIITVLARWSLRERLALFLLILEDRYKELHQPETAIKLPREDLANMIGTARESLGRLLKEFQDDKLIQIHRRDIVLIDKPRMVKLTRLST